MSMSIIVGKYDTLKEPPCNDFWGDKYVAAYSLICNDTVLHGFPDCPNCEGVLTRDFWLDLWHCTQCRSNWDSVSLISALKREREEESMDDVLTKDEMDTYAEEAENELLESYKSRELSVSDVARWWEKWYMKTGHKRLGRILLKFAGEE